MAAMIFQASDISLLLIIFATFGLTFASRDDMHGHSFMCLAMFNLSLINVYFWCFLRLLLYIIFASFGLSYIIFIAIIILFLFLFKFRFSVYFIILTINFFLSNFVNIKFFFLL